MHLLYTCHHPHLAFQSGLLRVSGPHNSLCLPSVPSRVLWCPRPCSPSYTGLLPTELFLLSNSVPDLISKGPGLSKASTCPITQTRVFPRTQHLLYLECPHLHFGRSQLREVKWLRWEEALPRLSRREVKSPGNPGVLELEESFCLHRFPPPLPLIKYGRGTRILAMQVLDFQMKTRTTLWEEQRCIPQEP